MVYFDKKIYAYVFEHFPATGLQNGDEVSPSNIFGWSRSFSENAHKSGPHGIFFFKFHIHMYFSIVKQLVCKTVTRLHRASFWPVKLFK